MTHISEQTYQELFDNVREKINSARSRAALAVNSRMIFQNWEIGNLILERQEQQGWGAAVIDRLSNDLKNEYSGAKGYSARNLKYMRKFAKTYPLSEIVQQAVAQLDSGEVLYQQFVQQAVAQLPWGHNILLMEKLSSNEERFFYAKKCIQSGWSRDVLMNQVETGLYERAGNLINNFQNTLPATQSELTRDTMKDPYIFDFLNIEDATEELKLEEALTKHITKFLLELGIGFAFMGRQYHLEVGGQDYYIDLLFYHLKLRCYIVIELKNRRV